MNLTGRGRSVRNLEKAADLIELELRRGHLRDQDGLPSMDARTRAKAALYLTTEAILIQKEVL